MDIVTLALAKKYADSINSGITNITTENNKLIFTLQNGNTIEVPLTDLVNNVVTEEELLNKLKDYIKNTDFASAEKAGIIKVDATSYATELDNGKLKASTKTYENYKDMNNESFIGKGTLENVIAGKNLETANNKVTFVDKDSTDTEYPSAKAMYKVSNKLDTLKDEVLDTGEANDSFIHIEDSAISELQELEIEGVCEQKTTKGLNLWFNATKNQGESNGITFTLNKDGTYTLNGKNNGDGNSTCFLNSLSNQLFLKAGTYYTIKTPMPGIGMTGVYILDGVTKYVSFSSFSIDKFTLDQDIEMRTYLQVFQGIDTTFNNVILKPMISKEKITDLDYEPYTGGIASPNPEYPQEIKTIENSLKITSCNKNLFDGLLELGIYNNSTGEKESSIVSIRSVNYISVKPNTSYTVLEENNKSIYFHEYDKNKIFISTNASLNTPKTITTSANTNYLTINTRGSEDVTDINTKIIIVEGTTVTSFEEHIQSQITANLPEGEFIGKLNNTYKDALNVKYNEKDGKYHLNLYKNVGKRVYKGSNEGWWKHSSNFFAVQCNGARYGSVKCNNFISDVDASKNKTCYCYGDNFIRIKYDECETLTDFITWLSTHNTEVYYVLAEPYTVDLGVVDMPITYNEITNLFTDSNLLPQINAKYYRNFTKTIQNLQINNDTLKNELLSIENRLTALENANTTTTNTESTIESEETK